MMMKCICLAFLLVLGCEARFTSRSEQKLKEETSGDGCIAFKSLDKTEECRSLCAKSGNRVYISKITCPKESASANQRNQ